MLRTTALLCVLVALSTSVEARIITVSLDGSGDYEDIQSALDAAEDGDEVVVGPGEYVVTEPLDFNRGHVQGDWAPLGKNLVLRSEAGPAATTIRMAAEPADPERASVVIFDAGETEASVLEGFTLTGGQGTHLEPAYVFDLDCGADGGICGGGVLCAGWWDYGPDIACESECLAQCDEQYEACVQSCLDMCWDPMSCDDCWTMCWNPWCGDACVHECIAEEWRGSSPTLLDCVVCGNSAEFGGGLFCIGSTPRLSECTISGNSAREGGGVALRMNAGWGLLAVTDSVVWGNVGEPFSISESLMEGISYSCFEGSGFEGEVGNIHSDPLFCGYAGPTDVFVDAASPGPGDGSEGSPFRDLAPALAYRLSLQPGSPCIGAGLEGATMGASLGTGDSAGVSERTVHLAAGHYRLENDTLAHHASLVGEGADATVLEGTVHGLRTGARLARVAVTGGLRGGVVVVGGETPTVEACWVAGTRSAGVVCRGSSPTVACSVISQNPSGGLLLVDSSPDLVNCAILGNSDSALVCHAGSSAALVNCIVRANAGEWLQVDDTSQALVSYSCLDTDTVWPGEGNTNEAPGFVAPGYWDDGGNPDEPSDDIWIEGDYHLLPDSPCIDAGISQAAPATDLDGNPRWCGPGVDLGAYEAQTAECGPVFIRGDTNVDTSVDISDAVGILVYLFALDQMPEAMPTCLSAADADDDGSVNLTDAVYTLEFLFRGGSPIPAPWPLCGLDPTEDDLGCESFAPCDVPEVCDNGLDDDLDGLTDCEDPDCSSDVACPEVCANGIDDDADGLVDCEDPECFSSACPEVCDNGADDDADGLADCEDPDCFSPSCPEVCGNGSDDDADGLVDCEDPDCFSPACPEVCDNGADDDADGLVDCEDPDCSADAGCPELCDNDADDDADGLVDCEDPECAEAAVCIEICDNGVDDDGNSLVDCEDPDCAAICAIEGFTVLRVNSQGYTEYTHDETGIVFVLLPGGTFEMGGDVAANEQPVHEVTLSPFLIAKFEVSQEVWESVMGEWDTRFDGADLPVEQVSWEDCVAFCTATALMLPSEAQWEYACRAGTSTAFAFGECLGTANGNYRGTVPYSDCPDGVYRETTLAVGSLTPNAFGLHDVHGNVLEWCEDVYDATFYQTPEAVEPDPLCTSGSAQRVCRGGSFFAYETHSRSAYRASFSSSFRNPIIGFRPVAPLP